MAFVEPAVRSAVAEAHFGAAARAAFLASGTSENANGTRAGASAAPATAAEARSGAEASQDAPPAAVPSGGGFAKIITAVAEPRENGHANGHGNGHFCIDIEGGGAWGEEDADWDCEGGGAAASNGGDKPGENGHDASSPERPTANGGGAHASASAFAPPTPYPQQKQQQQPKPEAEDEDDGWGAASDAPPKPKPSLEDGGGRTRRPPSACPSASADLRPRSSRRGGALPARRVSWSETVVDPVRAPPRPPPRDLHVYALEAGLAHTVRMAEQKRTDIEQLEAAIEMTRSDIRAAVEAEPPTGGPRAEELYEELQARRAGGFLFSGPAFSPVLFSPFVVSHESGTAYCHLRYLCLRDGRCLNVCRSAGRAFRMRKRISQSWSSSRLPKSSSWRRRWRKGRLRRQESRRYNRGGLPAAPARG